MLISDALAQTAGGGIGETVGLFLPMILIFVVFYFFMIRPQQRKMKEHRGKLDALRRGDRILTGGGFYAQVTRVEDTVVTASIARGLEVRLARHTIMDVLDKGDSPPAGETPATGQGNRNPPEPRSQADNDPEPSGT